MSQFEWLSYRRKRGAGAGACKVDCGKEGRWSGPQQVYQEGPVQARAQTGTQMLGVGLPGYVGRLQHLLLVVGRDVLPWKLTWALRCRRSPAFVGRPLARDAHTVEGVRIVAVAGTVRLWRNVWECSRGLAFSRAFMVVVIEPRSVRVRVLLWRVGEATLGECIVAQEILSIWWIWTASHQLRCFYEDFYILLRFFSCSLWHLTLLCHSGHLSSIVVKAGTGIENASARSRNKKYKHLTSWVTWTTQADSTRF